MKVIAVVVTYNRYELLRECLNAISTLTTKPQMVVVVNNASTDKTFAYLSKLDTDPFYKIANLKDNIGGAGGFSYGIRLAMQEGCDYVWLMDDDTIPQADSLTHLCNCVKSDDNIGFANSRVEWIDGTEHIMNMPSYVHKDEPKDSKCRLIESASFVSLLVKSEAIKRLGLPYKEFFIWCDDLEYTQRIVNADYKGVLVSDSIVLHKTKENYGPSIDTAPVASAWKFYYGQRNSMFMNRAKYGSGILFYIKELNHLRLAFHNIGKRKATEQAIFKKNVLKGFFDGLKFRPHIEYI